MAAILAMLALIPAAHAQRTLNGNTIEVLKTKGQTGIVRFSDNVVPRPGQVFGLSNAKVGEFVEDEADIYLLQRQNLLPRDYTVGLSTSITRRSSLTSLAFSGTFGWNFGRMEFGPILSLATSSASGSASGTGFGAGAYIEVNFIPNWPMEFVVPGLRLNVLAARDSASVTNSTSGTTTTVTNTDTDFGGSFYGKFFVFRRASTALRLDLKLGMTRLSTDAGAVSDTYVGVDAGLQVYF